MSRFPEIQTLEHKLRLERDKLLDVIKTFPPEVWLHTAPDGWSVKDILSHVAHAEQVNVKFARLMLEQDNPKQVRAVASDYPDYAGEFELDRFNAYMAEKLREQSAEGVLQSLNETRRATHLWLDTLVPEQLERKGWHAAWGELTVRGMIKILFLHDKAHAQELARRSSGM
jgi:hypothetical protein